MFAFSLLFLIQQEHWTCEIVIGFSFLDEETLQILLVLFLRDSSKVLHPLDSCCKELYKSDTFVLVIFFSILFLRFCLGRSCFKNSLLFDCNLDVSQQIFWMWKKMQHQLLWNYNGMKPSKHSLKGLLTSSKIRWGVNHWTTICGLKWNI